MTAMNVTAPPSHCRAGKLLQVTRRRLLRWFRPPEAEVRRQRLVPHPFPGFGVTDPTTAQEASHEQHA